MASKGSKIVSIYLIWCIVFTSLSCSTSKKVSIVERTPEELIQSLTNRNIDFKYVNAKLSTSVDNPDESISGTMQVKMQKDSAILVSVKKFGIEAAKIYEKFKDKQEQNVLQNLGDCYYYNAEMKFAAAN